ncbi:cell surface hyaluronidase [Tachysurus vachellii]|uniref:cell surface hyaluronidase n=1 Tax=Tachysurus vachellii TaxID=175792 RepID=UPI00296B1FA9|nr:cell surface hyaluronidase [Tachysurus vachellii]
MQGNRGHCRLPHLLTPSSGSAPYAMTRVVPVRSPPPLKALPPAPARPKSLSPPPTRPPATRPPEVHNRRQMRNTYICTGVCFGTFFLVLILVLSLSSSQVFDENCPDHNLTLSNWNPGQNPKKAVVVQNGQRLKLIASATLHSLTIQSGGLVVFADNKEGTNNITLRVHFVLIEAGGAFHIGAPKCRYRSRATITLLGRSDDASVSPMPNFGRKFIGVRPGGTLELYGMQKPSWTLLMRTIPATGLAAGSYTFQKNFSRGINLRVVDQDTGALLSTERFDTHDSQNDSRKLSQMLRSLPQGRIVALAVGDSAAKNLLDETKMTIQDLLGSYHVYELKYRQAWALVSVVGGGNSSCSEQVREHENHDTGGKAMARLEFVTVDGVRFFVSAYSEWWNGYPISGFQVDVVDQVILNVQDDVSSWRPGDRIVVASTDYSMYQAEEFTLLPCSHCTKTQLRIQGKPQFTHMGEIVDGVDMRAEVALLSRNILIHGEMENSCYSNNWCQFYTHDTFGGHIKILGNFSSVHMSQVELKHMGQQAERDSHPVHFHMCGDVDEGRTYLDSLSIHHSFSRCVSIHATNGLLVRDTVGYDTLGHCFFLADGIEQRNTFYHNLGLVTRPGTILPTERNDTMCTKIRDRVHGGYTPSPATECKAVSTFWIANPNNNLINNAAAGSQDAGIWYIFHNSSTGDSHGLVPETKAELTPLGIFYNNRVHSNFKAGLFIDKGVKTSNSSAADPREYLCLDNNARFRPHENSDPTKLRVAALIDTLISFKNNDLGAWIRGGDIIIRNSGFADNGVGLSFASDGSYPKDVGSSQEVSESLFVGESRNRGTNGGQNKYWGVGGVDGTLRTLPRNKTFPIRGFQIYDGPLRLMRSTFRSYTPTPERFTTAVGFSLKNAWQLTPRNNLSSLSFLPSVTLRAFFGRPGQWFEDNDLDGDKNSIFHDLDGSVSGYPDTYVVRADNFLLQHRECVKVLQWNGCVCSGRYAQVYVKTQGVPNLSLSIIRDDYPEKPLVLRGINSQTALSQQYQPVLMLSKSYTLHWNGQAPKEVVLLLANFDPGNWVLVGLCYPSDTVFQVMSDIYDRQNNAFDGMEDYGPVSSLADLEKRQQDRKYFFDRDTGLLWLYARARHPRNGHSYCSTRGCERVKITATTSTKQTCNCTTAAYPKYSKEPSTPVPMPVPVPVTQPCNKCGASKLVFSSDPWNSYLQTQVKSLGLAEELKNDTQAFITVNTKQFNLSTTGFLAVTVDACTGNVIKHMVFLKQDSTMVQYFKAGIPARSIVLLASRGQPDGFAGVAQHLVPLGAAKVADLQGKESLSFFGFQGASSPPSWVSLLMNQGKEVVEKYIPLSLDEYLCSPDTEPPQRKDLELLRKARN